MKKLFKILILPIFFFICTVTFAACNGGGNPKELTPLSIPANLQIEGTTLTWTAVPNASGYVVDIEGVASSVTEPTYSLAALQTPKTYKIKVKATGDAVNYADSNWSTTTNYEIVSPSIVFNIKYYDVGGNAFSGVHGADAPITHTYGTATILVSPSKEGFDFGGWFLNSAGENGAVTKLAATEFDADIELYVKWTIGTYSISYHDVGGGDFSGEHGENYPATHIYDNETTLIEPTKEGYDFDGWFVDIDGEGEAITVLQPLEHSANIVLYAKWKIYDSGTGTKADPYVLMEALHLFNLAYHVNNGENYLDVYFIMAQNISLENAEWKPIGTSSVTHFAGNFNGNNNKISDFEITSSHHNTGFFGVSKGVIENVGLCDYNIVMVGFAAYTFNFCGALVGYNFGVISNCYSTGDINAPSTPRASYIGGLVGFSIGGISNCYTTGDVYAASTSSYIGAGGLLGSGSVLSSCYAIGSVTISSPDTIWVGGLAGVCAIISNSYATGNVSGSTTATAVSSVYAGGLVGSTTTGKLTNCYATGKVSGSAEATRADVGGLVGNALSTVIENCYKSSTQTFFRKQGASTYATANELSGVATAVANLQSESWLKTNLWNFEVGVWVFAASKYPTLNSTYIASTVVEISNASQLLALQGKNLSLSYKLTDHINLGNAEWIPLTNSSLFEGDNYTISNFKITTQHKQAGLFGYNFGIIKNVGIENLTINFTTTTDVRVGGLVGQNAGIIMGCSAAGSMNVQASSYGMFILAGGLVGYNLNGFITSSYANVSIHAIAEYSIYLGGLVGSSENETTSSISGAIANCYATGNVSGTLNQISYFGIAYAGGFISTSSGGITNCYATGNVTVNVTGDGSAGYGGGFAGYKNGGIETNCFSTGNVSVTSQYIARVGGYVGYYYSGSIVNCYRYDAQTFYRSDSEGVFTTQNYAAGTATTVDNFNTAAFYAEILGWSSDIWNFGTLDFLSGKLSVLNSRNK